MRLVDPRLPKHTRITAYTIFVLLLAAVITLGVMSISQSFSKFAHVGESTTEFRHQAQEELDQRFSENYAEEKTTNE